MASKLNATKKHYIAPSFKELDANAARTELEATGLPEDPSAEKMLSAIDEKLKEKTKKKHARRVVHTSGAGHPC